MSELVKDIVENVDIKPNKTKLIFKWIISGSLTLATVAYGIGQFKASFFNRLDKIEKSVDDNTKATNELNKNTAVWFDLLDTRIDKVYSDGYKAFDDFQQYNNKQLGIIIDYGKSDKDLLKRMLELNTVEKSKSVENELEQAKIDSKIKVEKINPADTIQPNIIVRSVPPYTKPGVKK